jgi:hypothetical protein
MEYNSAAIKHLTGKIKVSQLASWINEVAWKKIA